MFDGLTKAAKGNSRMFRGVSPKTLVSLKEKIIFPIPSRVISFMSTPDFLSAIA